MRGFFLTQSHRTYAGGWTVGEGRLKVRSLFGSAEAPIGPHCSDGECERLAKSLLRDVVAVHGRNRP